MRSHIVLSACVVFVGTEQRPGVLRYGKRSTIITSQLPVSKWYEYIGDSTIADAIMDRLSVSAHRFELKGASLRNKK
jgi:DNA replication protein DnaC